MEQFKRSVLDERGRVRPMTDRKAAEVAGAAADGILKLVRSFSVDFLFVDFSSVDFFLSVDFFGSFFFLLSIAFSSADFLPADISAN